MFSFGSSFDTDPQLPWAAAALRSAGDQMSRAEQLYGAMQEYLHEVAGPANEYATAALRRFKELQNSQAPQQRDAQLLARYLRASYPEKYDYVGDRAIQALVQRASAAARERALPPHAVDFLTGMMFGFGYGVLDDPLYAWVRRTLDDPLATTPGAKLERLRAKVRVYVDAMLSRPPAAPLSNA
jgi:hypothetical protein